MTKVLMVAEKPSICNAIATALSGGNHVTEGRTPPVHTFRGSFLGKSAEIKVTSVVGHVFSMDFPREYQNWDATDPVDLFSARVEQKVEKKGIVALLGREARGCHYLVLWLDCDREGENICFEVIQCTQQSMARLPGGQQQIFRAKFSAVTPSDIQRALGALGEPNEDESLAVEARQELDLKVGVAFSRFQTRFFQGKYGDLDSSLISYGPCQTPTLGFCVDRHDEIQTFQPERFWVVEPEFVKGGHRVAPEWARGRVFDRDVGLLFQALVEEARGLRVTSVRRSQGKRTRPQPMNTVEMLKAASKALGMGPHQAMQAAERLYLQGFLSYPRTESTAYPNSFDFRGALGQQAREPAYAHHVQNLLRGGYVDPRGGTDAGDHPPITPCRALVPHEVSGDMARLYDLVARHFLATLSPDATFLQTKVTFEAGPETFFVVGKQMLDPGFMAILLSVSAEDRSLPPLEEGELLAFSHLRLREGQTAPPGHLTEAELIGLMEKHGIGTDASIATHINNICERNYVEVGPGRTLVPKPLGILLVHGYYSIDPDLVLPKVRATIEKQCDLIAKGKARKDDVVFHSLQNFEAKFRYFTEKIERMDRLFEATFSPLAATGANMVKCGKCRRYMRYVHLRPQRLFCPTCNVTLSLPQNGTVKPFKTLKCPLDNFELVIFSLGNTAGAQGKTFVLCPYCYNHPPFDNLVSMGCDSCLHPSCQHSLVKNAVCPCPGNAQTGEECHGTVVLDPNSKPNWKMSCNECDTLVKLHAEINALSALPSNKCETCGSSKLKVQFHKDRTPLDGGETTYRGCLVCDDLLNAMTEILRGRTRNVKVVRAQRRGRGRRGRGRGRGRGGWGRGDPLMSFEDF